jgi:hypothetical protein
VPACLTTTAATAARPSTCAMSLSTPPRPVQRPDRLRLVRGRAAPRHFHLAGDRVVGCVTVRERRRLPRAKKRQPSE